MCVCNPPFAGENCESCADANFVLNAAGECQRCVAREDSRRQTFQVSGVPQTLQLPVVDRAVCLAGRRVEYVNSLTREIVLPAIDVTEGTATGVVTCETPTKYNVRLVGGTNRLRAGLIRCIPQFKFIDSMYTETQQPAVLHFHSLSNDEGPVLQAVAMAVSAWAADAATQVRVTRHSSEEVSMLTAGDGNTGLEQLESLLMQEQRSNQCTLKNFAKVSGPGTDVSMVVVGDLAKECTASERSDYGNALAGAVTTDCRSCVAWVGTMKPTGPASVIKIKHRNNVLKFLANTVKLQNFFAAREALAGSTCTGELTLQTFMLPAESRRSVDVTSVSQCDPTECCLKIWGGLWEFYSGANTQCTAVIREGNALRCPLPLIGGAPGLKVLEVRGGTTVSTPFAQLPPDGLRNYAARVSNGVVQVTLVERDSARHCCRWVGVAMSLSIMPPSAGDAMPSVCWEATEQTSALNGWSGSYGELAFPSGSVTFPEEPLTISLQCSVETADAVAGVVPHSEEDLFHDLMPPSSVVGLVQDKKAWLAAWEAEQLPEQQLQETARQFACPSTPSAPFQNGFFGFLNGDPVVSVSQLRPVDEYRRSKHAHVCYKMEPSATELNVGFGVRCCYDGEWNYIAAWPSRLFLTQTELSTAAELNAEELACSGIAAPAAAAGSTVREGATCLSRTSSYDAGLNAKQCQTVAQADGCVTLTHGGATSECHCCVVGENYTAIDQWNVYSSGYTGVPVELSEDCRRFGSKRPASAAVLSPFDGGLAWETLPISAWGHGDPHCETVDGAKFPCNFEGEVRWAYCGEWRMHVVAEELGMTSETVKREGTVITRAAFMYGEDLVEVSQESVFLNGEVIGETRTTPSGLNVLWESDTRIVVATRSGNRAEVHRIPEVGLALGTRLSSSCDGEAQGLMGNNNGVAEDDLSGFGSAFTLASTATEEAIYDAVVVSFLVTDPADSLFDTLPFLAGNTSYRPDFMTEERMSQCPAACNVEKDETRRVACCFDASVGGDVFLQAFLRSRRLIDASNQGAMSSARANLPPTITGPAETIANGSKTTLIFTATDAGGLSNFSCRVCDNDGVTCTGSGAAGATEMTVTIQATFTTNTSFSCTAYDTDGLPGVVQPKVVVTGAEAVSGGGTRTSRKSVNVLPIVLPSVLGGVLLSFLICLSCCYLARAKKRRQRQTATEPYGQSMDEAHKNPFDNDSRPFSPRSASF